MNRMLGTDGMPLAYQMLDLAALSRLPSEESRTAAFLRVESPFLTEQDGIFLYVRPRKIMTDVLDQLCGQVFSGLPGKEIIFFDEIGGVELLSRSFRDCLTDILKSPVLCTGIIKQESGARDAAYWNGQLRELLDVRPMPQDSGGLDEIYSGLLHSI